MARFHPNHSFPLGNDERLLPHPSPPFFRKRMKQNMLGLIFVNKRRKHQFPPPPGVHAPYVRLYRGVNV